MKNRVDSHGQFRFTWPFRPKAEVLAVKGSVYTVRIKYGPTRQKTFELDVVYFGPQEDLVAGIQNGTLCSRAWNEASLPKFHPAHYPSSDDCTGMDNNVSGNAYPRYLTNLCE